MHLRIEGKAKQKGDDVLHPMDGRCRKSGLLFLKAIRTRRERTRPRGGRRRRELTNPNPPGFTTAGEKGERTELFRGRRRRKRKAAAGLRDLLLSW